MYSVRTAFPTGHDTAQVPHAFHDGMLVYDYDHSKSRLNPGNSLTTYWSPVRTNTSFFVHAHSACVFRSRASRTLSQRSSGTPCPHSHQAIVQASVVQGKDLTSKNVLEVSCTIFFQQLMRVFATVALRAPHRQHSHRDRMEC